VRGYFLPLQETLVSKRTIFNLGKYLLAFGLLAYVVYANWSPASGKGLGYVWQRHVVEGYPIHAGFLALGFAIFTASILLTLVRWYILVRAQDLPFRLADAVRLGLVGFFFNTVLPGSIGGDIVKAAFLAREQARRTVAVATVIMDRAIALWALVWFVTLAGGVFWATGNLTDADAPRTILTIAAVITAASALAWLLLGFLPTHRADRFADRLERLPRVGGSVAEFWRAVWMYRCRQKAVLLSMLITVVGQSGFAIAFYCSAHVLWDGDAVHNPIPTLVQHFLIVPVGLVVQTMPLFPGGAGIGELGFGLLYRWFSYPEANGVLSSLVMRVLTWIVGLVSGLVYLRMRARLPDTSPSAEEIPDEEEPLAEGAVPLGPAGKVVAARAEAGS
jgi:uncharacterized protein (TIRG00374 family)